jgi:hypothetical protein
MAEDPRSRTAPRTDPIEDFLEMLPGTLGEDKEITVALYRLVSHEREDAAKHAIARAERRHEAEAAEPRDSSPAIPDARHPEPTAPVTAQGWTDIRVATPDASALRTALVEVSAWLDEHFDGSDVQAMGPRRPRQRRRGVKRLSFAAFLFALVLGAGHASASRPSPTAEIPAAAFHPFPGGVAVGEPDRSSVRPRTSWTPAPSPESTTRPPAPGSISSAKRWAADVLGAVEFACLSAIVEHESRWNPLARNPVSGAFGLPQALHGLTSTDPLIQLRWAIAYGERRYGSMCAGLAFQRIHSWW